MIEFPPKMSPKKEKEPKLLEKGRLPEIITDAKGEEHIKRAPRIIDINEALLEKDKEVHKTRKDLQDFVLDEMPYINDNLLDEMNGEELMDLYLYYYNQSASYNHFLEIISKMGNKKIKDTLREFENSKKLEETLTGLYTLYLFNKLPSALKKNYRLDKDKLAVEVIEEINERKPEIIEDVEIKNDVIKLSKKLTGGFVTRQSEKMSPIIGFHTSGTSALKNINVPLGIPQTNIGSNVGEIHAGAKFLNFDLDNLYGKGAKFLYLVNATSGHLEKIYDSTTAAYSHGQLEIPPNFKAIHMTPEVVADLNCNFGAQ